LIYQNSYSVNILTIFSAFSNNTIEGTVLNFKVKSDC